MKTTLVVLIFVLSSFCIAQNVITQTITVDAATLSDIRNTLDTSHYNCDEILINCSRSVVTVYEAEELLPDVFPAGYDVIKNSANKLQNILFPTSTDDPIAIFDGVVNNINATSSVQDIMNYFTGTGYSPIVEAAKRGLSLVYLCLNASYLYDCFYYKQYTAYGDPNTDVIMAVAKLRQVMCECIHLLEDSEVFYQGIREGTILGYKQFQHGVWAKDFRTYSYGSQLGEPPYPGLNLHQYRLNMYGASGLAALLIAETTDSSDPLHTEMISMISYIDSMLENVMIPEVFPVDYQKQGMLAFHTSNSGAYNESLAYAGFLLKNITPYFVARKRLSLGTKNHFDNPYIVSWVNDITKKIVPSPDGSSISKNWNYNDSCNQGGFYPSVLLFFYHASNIYSEEKNNVAWLVNCSRNGSGSYKYIEFGSTSLTSPFIMRYSSDPTCNPKISDIDYIPDFILNGAWSNSEFSILRKPATFQSGFLSSSSLNVLHENSWASAHAHADQTSFSYFYGGERYLLDSSGSNFSDNHSWRISPYAHNMVIINPNESLLNSSYYRPVSGIQDFNKAMLSANEIEPDPCTKEYFQSSPLLDILRVRLDYRNPAGDNLPRIAQLKRTFIRDDEIYIVFDDIEAQNPPRKSRLLEFTTRRCRSISFSV